MSVNEYVSKFTQLSHYAPHEVYIDEKKQECFLNGLSDGLAYAVEGEPTGCLSRTCGASG
jgi:hypothetical protein